MLPSYMLVESFCIQSPAEWQAEYSDPAMHSWAHDFWLDGGGWNEEGVLLLWRRSGSREAEPDTHSLQIS